jgi:hypothetical protein
MTRFIYVLFLAFFLLALGLNHVNGQVPNSGLYGASKPSFNSGLGAPKVNVNVGSQVGTSFNNNYWFTNYIAPTVNFDLTKRFTLQLSTGVAYTSMHNMPAYEAPDGSFMSPVNSISAFARVSGLYKLNEKTMLSGSALFEQTTISYTNPSASQYYLNDFSIGVHYKPTANVHLNASFGVSNGPVNNFNSTGYGAGGYPHFTSSPIFTPYW